MVRVVFCCHGNICRSPMAQSVFAHMVQEEGLADKCYIDSMATSTEEIGNTPHWGTVQKLREVGIPLVPHRARQITWRDYERFDYIIGMDEWNMKNLRRMLRGDPHHKVYKLLSFAGFRRDIADPWYTGDFDAAYADVVEGCSGLLDYLREKGSL
ncbi:MAG: low molecular weight phosphotyrosine protein phosphatase [Clostridiales bacterium]|nr:low molecular weight phosphotyrosine protein phosphatase [Clostridiales bacterium]